jgi:hypothetical protein
MLAPDTRAVAMEVLRPPSGYRLDQAVLTTYSLDLDVLLALPLAVLAQSDRGIDELLSDPLLVLEALREAGRRVHVFVDAGGIARPAQARDLFSLLEACVHPVRAPHGGAFHPKVWIVRFVNEAGDSRIRVAVASRNLTFDRSWDVALISESTPHRTRTFAATHKLASLVRALPGLSARKLDRDITRVLASLADDLERTHFPAPEGFEGEVSFQVLGLGPKGTGLWQPAKHGDRLLAIAPFASSSTLKNLSSIATGKRTLISRAAMLDELSASALEAWDDVLVLSESAVAEPEDDGGSRPSGLHAKLIAVEHGDSAAWFVGSANLTHAAFNGQNVEVMAALRSTLDPDRPEDGASIEAFSKAGFPSICDPYLRTPQVAVDPDVTAARQRIEAARQALLDAPLRIVCKSVEGQWRWRLLGAGAIPEDVGVTAWPATVHEDRSQSLAPKVDWVLPVSRLTTFAAFRLSVAEDIDDLSLTLKLPAENMPEGRVEHVLRMLIDTPERFLQFLRALLGGIEGLVDWASGLDKPASSAPWRAGLNGETLLDDLVRAASRRPQRLEPIRRLITDLRSTPEGSKIVPDDLYQLWLTVEEVVQSRPPPKRGSR